MLAASPALPYVALSPTILHALGQEPFREGGPAGELLASPAEALTVFDCEAVAKEKLHYGHVAFLGGTEDEGTCRANREGFTQYQLRVRRLVDISRIDMSLSLFGSSAHSPILLCLAARSAPSTGAARWRCPRGAHPGPNHDALERGEPADRGRRGGPRRAWSRTLAMIKRAEAAGCPVLAWTFDSQGGGKRIVPRAPGAATARFAEPATRWTPTTAASRCLASWGRRSTRTGSP